MKSYRARGGPVSERPYYKPTEIEQICTDALRKVGLYPEKPEPIRIERFVEKHFKIRPEYHELPGGLLGYTKFGPRGVEQIVVSRSLAEQGDRVAERQVSSTLAHEAGHGLLQGHLFVLERDRLTSLFGQGIDPQVPKILCRTPSEGKSRGYSGDWWEFQENQAIGGLLLPRSLALQAVADLTISSGTFGQKILPVSHREKTARHLAEIFDVNPAAARIRLEDIFPEAESRQLAL
jgi:hypothetical protein